MAPDIIVPVRDKKPGPISLIDRPDLIRRIGDPKHGAKVDHDGISTDKRRVPRHVMNDHIGFALAL
jgi:hypothetical protein